MNDAARKYRLSASTAAPSIDTSSVNTQTCSLRHFQRRGSERLLQGEHERI